MTPKVILGSSSPYRKELLSRLGIPFECVSPDVDETPLSGETPQALCQRLARLKAQAVHALRADAIVIGSEGDGMGRLVTENCDFTVSIPMFGKINSLNASVAGSILMYEAMKQRISNK